VIGVLVAGSTFGAVHAYAVKNTDGMELLGLLGSGSSRTLALAAGHGVAAHSRPFPAPGSGAVASVVLRSTALGGNAVPLALELLSQGWNVLVEQPIRADEIKQLAGQAMRAGVAFRVGNLYLNLPPVARCLRVMERLRLTHRVKQVRVLTSTQTLLVGAAVLRRLCGQAAPRVEARQSCNGITTCLGSAGGVSFCLQVHNEHDPADRDNGGLGLVSAEVITDAGGLVLGDAAGPLTWVPRVSMGNRDVLGMPTAEACDVPRGELLCPHEPRVFAEWIRVDWCRAVAEDIRACAADGAAGGVNRHHVGQAVADATWWTLLSREIGLPETVNGNVSPVDAAWFAALGDD